MTTLVIEHLKASDLPQQWAERLNVLPGQTVTVRIETETLSPAQAEASSFTTDDPAFGIWRAYDEAADVEALSRRLRSSRYNRDGSRHED